MSEEKKKILIIHTGGTIGMIKTESGYAPKKGYLPTVMERMEDLYSSCMPIWDIIELDLLLDSSNVTVNEWNIIASMINEKYKSYDGFVILHGTDTMAYTASALSFMLEGLNKPVILTGSQIPFSEIRSDARDNLITSMLIAADGIAREVCLYFGGRLMRGNRSTKMSADRLIAFSSPNYPDLAVAGIDIKYGEAFTSACNDIKNSDKKQLTLHTFKEIPIGVLKIFPGIQFSLFESIMTDKLRGIVLETFGAGNIPGDGQELLAIIKRAFTAGTVITVCSQCPQGTVSLGTYEASSMLKAHGAVSGYDMTTEAAVAKLYYLFSCGYTTQKIKELMETNLCGEITLPQK
ncbi:MAG: asparaginase [Eubacteriales bacterium]|nr:asparaginase [Eubacteriales bacterium]